MKNGGQVGRQLVDFLTGLTQGKMDDGEFGLGFVGNGSARAHLFGAGDGVGDDGAVLGVRHQAFGAEDLGVLGQLGHVGGGGQKDVEVKLVIVEGGDSFVGENFDADGFAGRKGDLDLTTETGFEGVDVEIDTFVFATGSRDELFEGRLEGGSLVTVDFFDECFVPGGAAVDTAGIFIEVAGGNGFVIPTKRIREWRDLC